MLQNKFLGLATALTIMIGTAQVVHAQDTSNPLNFISYGEDNPRYSVPNAPKFNLVLKRASGGLFLQGPKGLSLRLDPKALELPTGRITVIDDILQIEGIDRAIDLRNFEGEVYIIGHTNELRVIKGADGNAHDVIAEVDRLFPDLVAAEHTKIRNGEVLPSTTKPDAVSLEIMGSLRSGKSVKLLGKSGVGKTTQLREIARRIALGEFKNVPRTLQLRSLDVNRLASGTTYRGSFEVRLDMAIAYTEYLNPFWTVDEAHGLAGSGATKGGDGLAIQALKQPVEDGKLRMIAMSTLTEWNNAFGSDPAWNSRFDPITLEEPSGKELETKIRNSMTARGYLEPSLEVTQLAIQLSEQFAVTGAQPRKGVNLLMKAQGLANKGEFKQRAIKIADVQKAAIQTYNIDPIFFDKMKVLGKLNTLKADLQDAVVGQKPVIDEISRLWFRKLTGVGGDRSAPFLILFGPPGVGKTFVSELSAKLMNYKTATIEMNQYKTIRDVEAFRHQIYLHLVESPNTVFILDEIEKAAIEVQDAALRMIQPGMFTVNFTDATGQHVFQEVQSKSAVFIATSNAGQKLLVASPQAMAASNRVPLGYRPSAPAASAGPRPMMSLSQSMEVVTNALEADGISGPMLSRAQSILPMFRPTRVEFRTALEREVVKTLKNESAKHKFTIKMKNQDQWVEGAMKFYDSGSDYRLVGKLIEHNLEPMISQAVIEQLSSQSKTVTLNWTPEAAKTEFPTNGNCEFILHARKK